MATTTTSAFNPTYALLGSLFGNSLGGLFGSNKNPASAAMPYLNNIQSTIQPYYQPYMDTGLNAMNQYYGNASNWATPQGAMNNYNTIAQGYSSSPYADYQKSQAQQAASQQGAASGMAGTPSQQLAVANQINGITSKDQQNFINSILGIQQQGQSGLGDLTHLGASETNDFINNIVKTMMEQAGLAYSGQANQNNSSDMFSSLLGLGGMAAGFIPFL